jgi:geranylgeranyl diphosphate synthase type I
VEVKIRTLVAQGLRHLDTAVLEPEAARRLRTLLRSATGAPATAASEAVPASLILTATDEEATR